MNRKQLLIGGGVAVALIVAYIWYRNHQAGAASSGGAPVDSTGATSSQEASDYATLAGMLQQQQAQEASDFASVQSAEAGFVSAAQEQADIGNVTGQLGGITGQIGTLAGQVATLANIPAGPAGAPGPPGTPGQVTIPNIVPFVSKEIRQILAGQKKDTTAVRTQQKKTGQTKRATTGPHPVNVGVQGASSHVSGNHPAGTAGHAVAQRSHGSKKKK